MNGATILTLLCPLNMSFDPMYIYDCYEVRFSSAEFNNFLEALKSPDNSTRDAVCVVSLFYTRPKLN